ncbi:hypothetical protein B0T10DRAFT_262079 [Thelonectria olida]|uniref:Uncharacterized protein n=1 Tax=Thelonectria olida TaxID=1576542 RepID=A0A9P9AIM5_9HYPO|nr:hypothetical protein B0T10DRAFT_262079 [Thelonectria olida]
MTALILPSKAIYITEPKSASTWSCAALSAFVISTTFSSTQFQRNLSTRSLYYSWNFPCAIIYFHSISTSTFFFFLYNLGQGRGQVSQNRNNNRLTQAKTILKGP